jgi:GT2 family glycosyltransferase
MSRPISVVVVTRGESALLERCVAAAADGTLAPAEILVVDQGRACSPLPPPARRLHVEAMGVSRARNLGAREAVGGLLAFTDDDCVPEPDWLAALARAVDEHNAIAATGRVLPLPDDRPGLVAVSSRTDTQLRVFVADGTPPPWEVGTGGNLLVDRETFVAVGGFDEALGPGTRFPAAEDIDLLERLLATGGRIVYTPEAVVLHEMKTARGRLKRRLPYGYGLGAAVGRAPRRRRLLLVRRFAAMQVRMAASGARRLSPRRVIEPLLGLAGFAAGLAAVRLRRR